MFGEMVSRGCVLTLENGAKVQATMYYKKNKFPVTMKELELDFVKRFNQMQPKMKYKVVKCHLMRN